MIQMMSSSADDAYAYVPRLRRCYSALYTRTYQYNTEFMN